jgi:hypothetical protein
MSLTDNYFPFDTGPGAGATPDRWRRMARNFYGSGVVPGYLNQCIPSLAAGVVTIGTGAMWIDGFYGENTVAKTVGVSGNGMVVGRMDPTGRTIQYLFVPNQTVPSQAGVTGIYEIPIMQVAGGTTGTDIRQFAPPNTNLQIQVSSLLAGALPVNPSMLWKLGAGQQITNTGGIFNLTFPVAFPHCLAYFHIEPTFGGGIRPWILEWGGAGTYGLTGVGVTLVNTTNGAAVASTAIGYEWWALGA